MPETKAQKRTAPALIRDRLGENVTAMYAARRDPVSGQLVEEHPILVVLADLSEEETVQLSGELTTDVTDALDGHYVHVSIHPTDAEERLTLPPEEVLPV